MTTTSLKSTIVAKSDQLNSDDLFGGPITITVRDVTVKPGADAQPASIYYEGDNNKPWKPCKSMCRVLVRAWGDEGKDYIGRRLTLFRDDKVMWAGESVGGIRISHMSHIPNALEIPLTASRGHKKKYTVLPLAANAEKPNMSDDEAETRKLAARVKTAIEGSPDIEDLGALWDHDYKADIEKIKSKSEAAYNFLVDAKKKRETELNPQQQAAE